MVGLDGPQSCAEVLAGLAKGGFITTSGSLSQLATLALVVAPMPAGSGSSDTSGQALLGLVTAFPAAGGPAVVVGPNGSASGGVLAAVRSNAAAGKIVSTVDDADDPGGDISVVLALQNASLGGVGQFGTGPGARGSLAAPSPS